MYQLNGRVAKSLSGPGSCTDKCGGIGMRRSCRTQGAKAPGFAFAFSGSSHIFAISVTNSNRIHEYSI